MSDTVELYGSSACPYTREMREHLVWSRVTFTEHDVDADPAALARLIALTNGRRTVPVLVRGGRVAEIGWRGRGCVAGAGGP